MRLIISDERKDIRMIRDCLKIITDDTILIAYIESYDEIAIMTAMTKIDMCDIVYFSVVSLYNNYIDFLRLYAIKLNKKIIILGES